MPGDVDISGALRKLRGAGLDMRDLQDEMAGELTGVHRSIQAQTPVRTGRLQRSTDVREDRIGRAVEVGWFGVPYARHVERRRQIIQAHVDDARRAANRAVNNIVRRIRARRRR